jgi:hypothetical protein
MKGLVVRCHGEVISQSAHHHATDTSDHQALPLIAALHVFHHPHAQQPMRRCTEAGKFERPRRHCVAANAVGVTVGGVNERVPLKHPDDPTKAQ